MKRILSILLAFLLPLLALSGCGAPDPSQEAASEESSDPVESLSAGQSPVTVTSVFGGEEVELTYDKAPERVVSLAGFATEMLLALGLEDKIVGYAWQDNPVLPPYQEAFDRLHPLCDPGMDPGEETVLAAQPEMVLSWASWSEDDYFNYENLAKHQIQAYGFHCERTEGANLEDVYTDFLNLGKIFRVEERAQALVDEMRRRISAVQERVKEKEPVRVFVCDIGSSEEQAFTAGGGLPADLLEKAGGKNIIQDVRTNFTRVSWEVIAEADPDWIVFDYYTNADDVDGTIDFLKTHPALQNLDAVKNERFIILGLTDLSAGERCDDTVEQLASYFHPED